MTHVAILIPSCGQRELANLARDAIAAFTTDVSHEVWLVDHPRGAPWPENGSEANGLALRNMIQGASWSVVNGATHIFAMHDDALPTREAWLSDLLAKQSGRLGHRAVVGVNASERNGYAHASGVLMDIDFANAHSMLPDLPMRDAGEWPAGWLARSYCHRPPVTFPQLSPLPWWWHHACDLSHWKGEPWSPFYIHFGGGTIKQRLDTDAWIKAARKGLGL